MSPRFFEALIEHSHDAVALVSANATILYASPASPRLLGYSLDEIMAQPAALLYVHPDDRPRVEAKFATLLAQPKTTVDYTIRCRHKSGEWRWLEVAGTNLLHDPEIDAIVANFRDVTDRMQQAEARVTQAKLEGALLVARTAAHELLNALQPVSGFAELLSVEPTVRTNPRLAAFAKHIRDAALDAAERVRRLQRIVRLTENTTMLGPDHPVLDLDRSTAPE